MFGDDSKKFAGFHLYVLAGSCYYRQQQEVWNGMEAKQRCKQWKKVFFSIFASCVFVLLIIFFRRCQFKNLSSIAPVTKAAIVYHCSNLRKHCR